MPASAVRPEWLAAPLWTWGALLVGLIVGSFANVCIHRLPRGESIVSPRSRCPRCGAQIRAWQNVPLLSYVLLRGRCAGCGTRISPRYPAVEAANGLTYWGLAVTHGPTPRTVVLMVFATAFIILAVIDLEHQILPDVITLPGIALALGASFLPGPPSPLAALVAALAGYVTLAGVAWAAERYYKEAALGEGDWKLAALLGALFGWRGMLLTIVLATSAGALVGVILVIAWGRSGRTRVPLGTFLAAAALAVMLWGEPILAWYGSLAHA